MPRQIFFVVFTTVLAVAFGLREPWVLAPGLALHFACVRATRYDPQFLEVFRTAYKNPPRMEL